MIALYHPRLPPGGRLWGASRPGYPRSPAMPREVEASVRSWVGVGVEGVLNLMEDTELVALCPGYPEALRRHDLELLRFPIVDFGVPADAAAFCDVVTGVRDRLARSQAVLVHCNAGQGRTAVFLASLLKACGHPGDAIEEIRRIYYRDAMRGENQEAFVRSLSFPSDGRP